MWAALPTICRWAWCAAFLWVPEDDGSGCYLSIPSEILPEVVWDRFVAAQLEWMQMKSTATAAELRAECEKNPLKPVRHVDPSVPFGLVAQFPYQEFVKAGHKAISQAEWVVYIVKVALIGADGNWPMLGSLTDAALGWLKNPTNRKPVNNTKDLADICASLGKKDVRNSMYMVDKKFFQEQLLLCIEDEKDAVKKEYACRIAEVPYSRPLSIEGPAAELQGGASYRPLDVERRPLNADTSVLSPYRPLDVADRTAGQSPYRPLDVADGKSLGPAKLSK